MRVLLDNDVILDLLLDREPFAEAAARLWELGEQGRFEPYVSANTPVNVFYVARKLKGRETARLAVGELLAGARVCPVGDAVLRGALALPFADYEDAVQHTSAALGGLDAIVTRNLGDYRGALLPVFSPPDSLTRLDSES